MKAPVEMSSVARPKSRPALARLDALDRQQRIGAPPGSSKLLLGDGARRHQPHHVALHDRFGAALLRLGRVLHLLADRDAMAKRDQAIEVVVGALDRHAAHANVLAVVLAALGQHDAERAARDLRVLEEQLVEIAHPVEQQAVGIGGLDLEILRHHRRQPRRGRLGVKTGGGKVHGTGRLAKRRGGRSARAAAVHTHALLVFSRRVRIGRALARQPGGAACRISRAPKDSARCHASSVSPRKVRSLSKTTRF